MAETTFVSVVTESPGLTTGIGAVFLGVMLWISKASKLKVGLTKDRAEEGVIHALEKQRDDAFKERDKVIARLVELEHERSQAREDVARLTSEVKYLREGVETLEGMVTALTNDLKETREELKDCFKSNHAV